MKSFALYFKSGTFIAIFFDEALMREYMVMLLPRETYFKPFWD